MKDNNNNLNKKNIIASAVVTTDVKEDDLLTKKHDMKLKNISEAEKLKDKEESRRLWAKYVSDKKPAYIRDQLITKFSYLVKWVIGRFPKIETADFDKDDLIGYGCLGLIEAVDRYNPDQNCSFETFAINRIRGEVLDFLRSRDFLSRTSRTRVKRYQAAYNELEAKLGRAPTDEEMMKSLNLSEADYRKIMAQVNVNVYSLDSADVTKPFEDSKSTLVDSIASDEITQEEMVERILLKEKLAQAIDSLQKRDRLVVALYHYQKLTFKEIGEILGVSESRASQLHMKALQKLKVIMKDFE